MPGREIPLATDQIYHIINRGIASQPIFLTQKDYLRALDTILYYQYQRPPLRFSFFQRLSDREKVSTISKFKTRENLLAEIIAYCLMPNHFHLLLKQTRDGGISIFMGNFSNSYTRYFNTKQKRIGPILQGKFKAIIVETDWQLIHLSRYIHLNPYSSFVVTTLKGLQTYPYSSLQEYLESGKKGYCNKEIVMASFRNVESYKKFILDQADYQRELDKIKHLTIE